MGIGSWLRARRSTVDETLGVLLLVACQLELLGRDNRLRVRTGYTGDRRRIMRKDMAKVIVERGRISLGSQRKGRRRAAREPDRARVWGA